MRKYKHSEFYIEKGVRYIDFTTKEDLILFEDTLRGKYYGISEVSQELEEIRNKFYKELSTQFSSKVYGDRKDNLKKIAHILIEGLTKLKGLEWPSLPADTRPGANKSTLADHSLLTSAIATCLIHESLHLGRGIDSIVRVIPSLDKEELLALTRIASLCHDLGKHPYMGHRGRSIEAIKRIFKNILLEELIDVLTGVALRHHSSRYAREAGETPQGFFEEVICHADTASRVDRPTEILEEDYGKTFDEIILQRNERGFLRYPVRGETIFSLIVQLKEWEEEEFKGKPPLRLILADVDRVKGYVFETAKLPEVRGASLILDHLNRGDLEDEKSISYTLCKKGFNYEGEDHLLAPECILYAAGGSCLILAPSFLAEQIAYEIKRLYLEETGWATISVATLPIHIYELPYGLKLYQNWFDKFRESRDKAENPREKSMLNSYLTRLTEEEAVKIKDQNVALFQQFLKTKRFGELTSRLNYLLKKKKEERDEVPIFELTPFARRCASCEIRTANILETHPEEQYLCEICDRKRKMGIKKKEEPKQGESYFIGKFEEYVESTEEDFCIRYNKKKDEMGNVEVASDLASIGNTAKGRAEGSVGVIYADGNDIGRHLEEISTPAEYRHFAQTLLNVVESSVFKSLAMHLIPERSRNQKGEEETIHPFEIITIGGDDLFLIVPADKALRIAYSICHHFEEEFKEGKRLTMSAGVVIAKTHSPIYFLQKLSEELLKSAKKKSRDSETGAIDFLVLTSEESAATSLDQIREKLYEVKADSVLERLKLTERPFTLSELKTLLETAKKIKEDFPRAQLYAIRQSLEKGRPFSTNFFFYQLARMKEEYQKMMKRFINKWWSGLNDKVIPYKLKDGEYVTPFVDLVEIIDFAEGEEI